jgi:hypothetical protein
MPTVITESWISCNKVSLFGCNHPGVVQSWLGPQKDYNRKSRSVAERGLWRRKANSGVMWIGRGSLVGRCTVV